MALSAVSSATSTLGNLLTDEAKHLWGVKGEVQRLEMELSWMQCFLSIQDVDVQQDVDKRIQKWVEEVRQLAYDAEDLVESFALKIKSVRKGGFLNNVKRWVFILKELRLVHQTRSSIEEIQTRIADLSRRLQTYGIKKLIPVNTSNVRQELTDIHRCSASNLRRQLWQSYSYIEEDNILGLTGKIKEVIKLLTKDRQCGVVSICAMSGIGKTALAKKVFNNNDVRKEFDYCAWVYVSQEFQRRKVWEKVLSSFNKMDEAPRNIGESKGGEGSL